MRRPPRRRACRARAARASISERLLAPGLTRAAAPAPPGRTRSARRSFRRRGLRRRRQPEHTVEGEIERERVREEEGDQAEIEYERLPQRNVQPPRE
ncbi:transmembrane pair domain protein [Burkholderia pseudomallei]|nr:transmembrane pair domain protein [Burkholderia pseudomallei]